MKYFILLVLSFTNLFATAQATLTGIVKDENNKAIANANIVLSNAVGDTIITKQTSTNNKGGFEIQQILPLYYTLKITSIGFEDKLIPSFEIKNNTKDLGIISLQKKNKTIKEVTITSTKATIELQADKKVFNVASNATSAGGTTIDVLKNVPGVGVDADGNISVRGKDNITLLVDGKPSSMFGSDAQTALQTIPAASIESIEVITNPSSKYEAQGMGGIINIILKKDRKPGYNGSVNLGIGLPARLNGGINLNANNKKWNYFLNVNTRIQKIWEETTNDRTNLNTTSFNNSFNHTDRRPLSGFINMGTDYTINTKNKIAFNVSRYNACMQGNSQTDAAFYNSPTSINNTSVRNNTYFGNPLSGTANLKYFVTTKKPKEELNIELNYSKMRYRRGSDFTTNYYDSAAQLQQTIIQQNPVLGGNWNGTFQIDYILPISKNAKIEVGERSYYIKFKSENQPTIQLPNQLEIEETILKNKFIYTQQVHGTYINVANTWHKTSAQVGLRAEYFSYEGFVYQYNLPVRNSFKNIFPTMFISHKKSDHEDIAFNYSRRINRPGFRELIPYIDVTNPIDTSAGNPNLNPEFIHASELSYSNNYGKGNTIMTSIYYQYTTNLMQRFRRFNANGTTFSQTQNLANAQTYGLEITTKQVISKLFDATLNVNLFTNNINGKNIDASASNSGWGGFAKLLGNAKLQSGYIFQVTANYFAPTVIAQGKVKSYSNVDVAIKKSFNKNLYTLTLNATDIFNKQQTFSVYNYLPFYTQDVLRKNQTRGIGLNLSMRLLSKSQQNQASTDKKQNIKKDEKKELKNRDENLKKDEGGDEGGGDKK
jgi:outer membrane receptor protein involved in Fe transport